MTILIKCVLAVAAFISVDCQHHAGPGAYSYNRFSGPVSGAIREVAVPAAEHIQQHADYGYDHNLGRIHPDTQKYAHLKTVDYVAKPDYAYAYGVDDPHTGNSQNHKESRDGDVVRGEYSLIEPDGSLRIVRYTADPLHGFQAVVEKEGIQGGKAQKIIQHFGHTENDENEDTREI